jgi:hypothetical protein
VTHDGPAGPTCQWMHQAGFSPRHWSDGRPGRAGTTILQLVSAFYDRTKHFSVTRGRQVLLEHGQRRRTRRGRRTVYGTTGRTEQREAAAELSVQQDLSKDYGPTGSSGRRHRLRRGRSTFRGTTGRTDPPDSYARVHRDKRTSRPSDFPGADRHVSQILGISSQASTSRSIDRIWAQ